jgi:hypothetical protein
MLRVFDGVVEFIAHLPQGTLESSQAMVIKQARHVFHHQSFWEKSLHKPQEVENEIVPIIANTSATVEPSHAAKALAGRATGQ